MAEYSSHLLIRITPEQKQQFKKFAAERGVSLSAAVRETVQAASEKQQQQGGGGGKNERR